MSLRIPLSLTSLLSRERQPSNDDVPSADDLPIQLLRASFEAADQDPSLSTLLRQAARRVHELEALLEIQPGSRRK